jgi:hypothetical protein
MFTSHYLIAIQEQAVRYALAKTCISWRHPICWASKNAGMTDIIHRIRLTERDFAFGWNLNTPNQNHCKHVDIAHSNPIHPAVLAPTVVPVAIRFNRL